MDRTREKAEPVTTDIEWEPPEFGMYNGYLYQGLPTKISNGKRTFIIKFTGDFTGANTNISVQYNGDWVIKSKKAQSLQIASVIEVFEAHLQIYPCIVPKLRIIESKPA